MTITFRVPPEIDEELRQVAREQDRSVTGQLLRYVKLGLEQDRREREQRAADEQPRPRR